MAAIEVIALKKSYKKHLATKNVTFSVNKGEIFGFVGPNGAGKSTTIRTLLNLIFADSGTATILGLDCVKDSKQIKLCTGYVPSDVRLYDGMSVADLLAHNAKFYNQSQKQEIERLTTLFGVEKHKRFRELSTGNKKKVSLVIALAAKPSVLILDEPTSGLDPVVQKDLFTELKKQASNGVTILLSSHNLAEVQEYCDRVAFIRSGEIIAVSNLADETEKLQKIVTVTGGGTPPKELELISTAPKKRVFRTNADGAKLLELLVQLHPDTFTVEQESIEARFMQLYSKEEK